MRRSLVIILWFSAVVFIDNSSKLIYVPIMVPWIVGLVEIFGIRVRNDGVELLSV